MMKRSESINDSWRRSRPPGAEGGSGVGEDGRPILAQMGQEIEKSERRKIKVGGTESMLTVVSAGKGKKRRGKTE